jgi:hypothetical protein
MKPEGFHDLVFDWDLHGVTIRRGPEEMARFQDVSGFAIEKIVSSSQDMLLLRFESRHIAWLFFADSDGVRTNLREVDPSLASLADVICWLLPPGYKVRQGDVGIYTTELPRAHMTEISSAAYVNVFAPVLKRRHMVAQPDNCRFFRLFDRFFLRIIRDTLLVHPEHSPVYLSSGDYEIQGARGTSYPILQNVQTVRGCPLFT